MTFALSLMLGMVVSGLCSSYGYSLAETAAIIIPTGILWGILVAWVQA